MSFVQTVLAFIVALGVLIVVHEFGHFIVARWCGVKVLRFSVGFGRALALWRLGADRTEWVIAAIPFGGYVKMLDEREGPVPPAELARAFNRQSVWKRFAIVVAGPLFNFAFAVLVYAGLFMYGLPEARPILGAPPAGTVAAAAGIHAGDTVRGIDGEAIGTWQELRWRVLQAALQREPVKLDTEDERGHLATVTLDLRGFPSNEVETDVLERVGLRLYRPPLPPVLGQVIAGGAAEKSGLVSGDRIVALDGAPIDNWEAFVNAVRSHPGTALALTVERAGRMQALEVVPESVNAGGARFGRIGAGPRQPEGYSGKTVDTRAAWADGQPREGEREDHRHRALQPQDARQDAGRRSLLAPSLRAGDDRRFRRAVGEPRLGFVSHVPRANQYQLGCPEPAADPAAGRRTPDVLCDRNNQRQAGLRAVHGARTARRSCAVAGDDGLRLL